MKKTINGIRYDTQKAILIGEARQPPSWAARLYKTPRSGNFFLFGLGDAMSKFGEKGRIVPMKTVEAREWTMKYLGNDKIYMQHFGG